MEIRRTEPRSPKFFVDDRCIACMVCAEIAPEIFIRDANREAVLIGRQPGSRAEIDRCEEAAEICPVDAIGCAGPSACGGPTGQPTHPPAADQRTNGHRRTS